MRGDLEAALAWIGLLSSAVSRYQLFLVTSRNHLSVLLIVKRALPGLFYISPCEEKAARLLLLSLLWPIAVCLKPQLVERIRRGSLGKSGKRVPSEQEMFVPHLHNLAPSRYDDEVK